MTSDRAQSHVIGVILLTAVVVTVVLLVGSVILTNTGGWSDMLADVDVEVNATTVTLTHLGGASVDTEDVVVILDGETTTRWDLASFTQTDGSDASRFEPGDEWVGEHSLDGDSMTVTLVHEPSNTILDRESVDVDPSGTVVFAVNSGGSAYTAADGTEYQADTNYTGGNNYTTTDPIDGTTDDPLYQSERYGNFSYAVDVPDGQYEVTFKLAEIFWTSDDQRIFDVNIEGQEVISDLDVHSRVGHDRALNVTRTVTVSDGTMNVEFVTNTDNAKSGAIKVVRD